MVTEDAQKIAEANEMLKGIKFLPVDDSAKIAAQGLKDKYPHLKTVEDVIDQASKDGLFADNDEMLAVWGRLTRILPNRLGTNGVK